MTISTSMASIYVSPCGKTNSRHLPCAICKTPCSLKIPDSSESEDIFVETSHSDFANPLNINKDKKKQSTKNKEYSIAIDIGTTTLVIELWNINHFDTVELFSSINHQISYGKDIISRIQSSMEGNHKKLAVLIRRDLFRGIQSLLVTSGISRTAVKEIVISGNAPMIHLLMDWSCDGFASSPFYVQETHLQQTDSQQLFPQLGFSVPIFLLPPLAPFVGGDIMSDLFVLQMQHHPSSVPFLLLDLGTNGELVLYHHDTYFVSSTSAGPAFEGGNLSCGTGSIPGAVYRISTKTADHQLQLLTIQDRPPMGICGTGYLSLLSFLKDKKLIDENGTLIDAYFQQGFPLDKDRKIIITQKDIRELQMAKAAIRTAIELLLSSANLAWDDLAQFYIAGGFGSCLDLYAASNIGIFSEKIIERITILGNASLTGAKIFSIMKNREETVEHIQKKTKEISLTDLTEFHEKYIKWLNFQEK